MARFEEEEVVAREKKSLRRKVIQPLRLDDFARANEKSFHGIFHRKYINMCALHDSIKIMRRTEYLSRKTRIVIYCNVKCAIPVC